MEFPEVQIMTTGHNVFSIDTETINPLLTTFHASTDSINRISERLSGIVTNQQSELDVVVQFEEYMTLSESDQLPFFISSSRNRLMKRVLKESTHLLSDRIFLTLLMHEDEQIRKNSNDHHLTSSLITLTKVMAFREKGKVLPVSERTELLLQEFKVDTIDTAFHVNAIRWIISLLSGDDSECAGKERVLDNANLHSYLENLKDSMRHGERGLIGYNETIQEFLTNPLQHNPEITKVELVRVCLTLFMANYSVGDMVSADYFLMKANELKLSGIEEEYLILFLKDTILMKSC